MEVTYLVPRRFEVQFEGLNKLLSSEVRGAFDNKEIKNKSENGGSVAAIYCLQVRICRALSRKKRNK